MVYINFLSPHIDKGHECVADLWRIGYEMGGGMGQVFGYVVEVG